MAITQAIPLAWAGQDATVAGIGMRVILLTLWVPNSSSTAVTSSVAQRWLSDMIVDRGSATAVSELPAAGGTWLGLPAGVRGRRISKPADKGGANQQQNPQQPPTWPRIAITDGRLAPTQVRHRPPTTQLPRESSTHFRTTTKVN